MDQRSLELLSAHVESLCALMQRAEPADAAYDELLDRIEALVIEVVRPRLH